MQRLPHGIQTRVTEAIDELSETPRPAGCKKMRGADLWRIRVGDYRIIYEIHDRILLIRIITVGHRREVYR